MNLRKSIGKVVFLCTCIVSFSQESNQESEATIDIPDVSTAIDGTSVTIDEQSIPDFTLILPEVETDFLLSLDLADENMQDDVVLSEDENKNSDFSLEGLIGGGYPGYFLGDINLIQYSEKSPFAIHFSHFSKNGLGSHLASDGYTENETALAGETTIYFDDMYSLMIDGSYAQSITGLQNKSPLFYQNAQNSLEGNALFSIDFPSSWNLGIQAAGERAERYLGLSQGNPTDEQMDGNFYDASIGFSFGKTSDAMDFNFLAEYMYSALDEKNTQRISGVAEGVSRLTQELLLQWDIGVVYEKDLNMPVLVPFSVFVDYKKENLNMDFSLGMKSEQVDYTALQNKYPFANFPQKIHEQSSWFSSFGVNMPAFENSTFKGRVDIVKTAFDQGVYQPIYASDTKNVYSGLYLMRILDVFQLDTDLALSTNRGNFGFTTGWNASWIDVLPEENAHEIYAVASVLSNSNTMGAQLTFTEAFFEDYTPIIDLIGFVMVTETFQVELQIKDAVKLVTGEDRNFAGDYVTDTGYVGIFARLYL